MIDIQVDFVICVWQAEADALVTIITLNPNHETLDLTSLFSFRNQLATLSFVIDPENIPRGFNLLAPDEVNNPYLSDPLA